MKDNLIIASKLLGDFNNFIANRSTTFLTRSDGMLSNILEWHFGMWKKGHGYLYKKDKLDVWGLYSDLSRTIDSIFREIETRALKERESFPFFERFKKHAEKYKKESEASRHYNEYLFDTFYQVFFQHIYDAPEKYEIWDHYFPKEWKITKSNLQNPENIISNVSLRHFLKWASGRIWQTREENDFSLNEVSSNLFPEVDPIIWAEILIFFYSPLGEDRFRSVIERPWNFGFGRAYIYSNEEEISKIFEEEEISTFELSYLLFKNKLSMINLEGYIKSLEKLSYLEESKEERKRLSLLSYFTKMLVFVRKKEQSKPNQSEEDSTT
ncbi:MAG: hypothetical protein AB1306_08850 [Nitrospirota bacterium]